MKILRKTMAAVAFAEAGEHEMARQFLREPSPADKKVILGVDSLEIQPKLIDHALNLCQRVGARLEILHILKPAMSEKPPLFPQPLVERLTRLGVMYERAFGSGKLEEELVKYAENQRRILFVVLDSVMPARQGGAAKRKSLEHIMDKLKCPVVVFSENTLGQQGV